jgi:hypothetical protein
MPSTPEGMLFSLKAEIPLKSSSLKTIAREKINSSPKRREKSSSHNETTVCDSSRSSFHFILFPISSLSHSISIGPCSRNNGELKESGRSRIELKLAKSDGRNNVACSLLRLPLNYSF